MQADEPLAKFLDYCTYGHMIDNVVLIVTGTLHERDVHVSALHCFFCQSLCDDILQDSLQLHCPAVSAFLRTAWPSPQPQQKYLTRTVRVSNVQP